MRYVSIYGLRARTRNGEYGHCAHGVFAYGDRSTGRWVQGFESGGTGAMMGLLRMSFLDGSRRFALGGLVGQWGLGCLR